MKKNVRVVFGGFVREVVSHAERGQWAVTDGGSAGYVITHLTTGAMIGVEFRDLADAVGLIDQLASLPPYDMQTSDKAAVDAIVATYGLRPCPGDAA